MTRKKTERIYTPVESLSHFARKIAAFGDKTAFRWLNKQHEILSMTYAELSDRIHTEAAGLAAAGLAGKRIAVIGETSPEWVMTYVSAIAAGGVAIPMDRELEAAEIGGFLEVAEADAIVFTAGMNKKLAFLCEAHPTVQTVVPVAPDEETPLTDRRVFDIASRMPSEYKVNAEQNKVAFRTAAAKVLPEEIAFRKKLGFIVPIRLWLADERYNADVRRLLGSEICAKFFKPEEVQAIYAEYVGGNSDLWRKVWTIYTFLVWYEEYFVKR